MSEAETTAAEAVSLAESDSRRAAPRHPCSHVTFYRPVARRDGEPELAIVRDISVSGIALLVRTRVNLGTILTIELNSTIRDVRHPRLARVTHVRDQENGCTLLGCEFASRLSEAELRAFNH